MVLDVGGYEQRPDWPKMGPALLIASCLILAIRTAKWPARSSGGFASDLSLDEELEHAIHVAGRVLSTLVAHHETFFPRKREAWYAPNDEDVLK